MTTATIVETRECDFCGEDVLVKAKKCKHCHETLDPAMRKAEEAMRVSTAGSGSASSAASATVVVAGPDTRPNFPHVFHFLMTVVTVGFWGFVWVLHYCCRGETYKN